MCIKPIKSFFHVKTACIRSTGNSVLFCNNLYSHIKAKTGNSPTGQNRRQTSKRATNVLSYGIVTEQAENSTVENYSSLSGQTMNVVLVFMKGQNREKKMHLHFNHSSVDVALNFSTTSVIFMPPRWRPLWLEALSFQVVYYISWGRLKGIQNFHKHLVQLKDELTIFWLV